MSELRKATMADAKAAWEAFPEQGRSLRKVVDVMRANGIDCPIANLQRWAKRGFAPKESRSRQTHKQHLKKKLDAPAGVSEKVSIAVEKAEKKAATRMEEIEQEEAAMRARRAELLAAGVQTSALQETAGREILVALILLAEQISRRAAILVEVAPGIASRILEVLAEASKTTTVVLQPPIGSANGDGAKVIDACVIEKSQAALAIENFLAREGVAA